MQTNQKHEGKQNLLAIVILICILTMLFFFFSSLYEPQSCQHKIQEIAKLNKTWSMLIQFTDPGASPHFQTNLQHLKSVLYVEKKNEKNTWFITTCDILRACFIVSILSCLEIVYIVLPKSSMRPKL